MQSWKPVFKSSSTYARTGPYTTVFISSTAIHSRVHMLHTSHSWRVDTCRSPQQLLIPRCFLVPSHYAVPKSYRRNKDWQFRRTQTVLGGPFLDLKSLHRCRRMHPKDSQIICSPGNPSLSPRRHMPVRGHTPRFSFHPLQSTAGYTCCTRPIPGELIHVGVQQQLLIPRCFLVPSHYAVPKSYRRNKDWQFRRTQTVLGGPFLDLKSLHRCRRMHPKDSQIICSPGNPSLSPRRHMPVRGHTPRFSFHPLQSTAGYTCCTRPIPGELIHVGVRNSSSYHDVSSSHPIMPYPNPTGATKIGNLEGHGPSCAVLFWTPSRCIDAEECIQKIHRLYAVLETRL